MNIKRTLISTENVGLAWRFDVSPSSCENPSYYKDYITLSAVDDRNSGQALTHLFVDEEQDILAGYISLRATSLLSEDPNGVFLVQPAIEIAELAVHKDYERMGIGTEMFAFALSCAHELRSHSIGIKYITVCSAPDAVGFYRRLGFEEVKNRFETPRDGWNNNCIPMYIRPPEY